MAENKRIDKLRRKSIHSPRNIIQELHRIPRVNHSRVRSTLRFAPEPVRTECFRRLMLENGQRKAIKQHICCYETVHGRAVSSPHKHVIAKPGSNPRIAERGR
ncbi:unnamed protein product, partial [Ectocarpus sp. 12 AP-2014]